MSKRPPEMRELQHPTHAGFVLASEHYPSDQVDDIIRSLRVQLFWERARVHSLQASSSILRHPYSAPKQNSARIFHNKAARRFERIARKIERGEL